MSGQTTQNQNVLVSAEWLKANLGKPGIRIVEVSVDPKVYDAGHIPGAVNLNWTTQLQDQVRRDIAPQEQFEKLLSQAGIKPSDTVVLYGDHSNWFAAYGFWLFKLYGHADVRLLDGGRAKWLSDDTLPLTTEVAPVEASAYKAGPINDALRARTAEVLTVSAARSVNLVDVRSPDEFSGKVIAPPGMSETAQRGGHIPGAKNVPWSKAVNEDGTFRSREQLAGLYLDQAGVDKNRPTIAYCRIGERSSHTWFVLTHLLGLTNVKNYDGSWTEYGNLVGAPIER